MTPRASVATRILSAALVLGLIGWIGYAMSREASAYDWGSLQMRPLPVVGAAALLLVAYVFRAQLWVRIVRAMGDEVDTVTGWRIFLGAQLGRYIPGKFWQIAGAGMLARRYDAPVASAAVATLLTVALHQLAGATLAMLVVDELSESAWLGAALAAGVAVLGVAYVASPLLPKTLQWVGRVTKNPEYASLTTPRPGTLLPVTLGFFAVWAAFALALWLVTEALFPAATLSASLALGSMAAAGVAGFLVLIAPSGLGVREAAMVALLSPSLGVVPAGILAISIRILMTITEVGLSLWGVWPYLRKRGDSTAV